MKVLDLLKGKKVNVMTDAKVSVQLEIASAKEESHSVNIGPATRENDWWNPTRDWTTIEITFTNGFKKSYSTVSEIDVID